MMTKVVLITQIISAFIVLLCVKSKGQESDQESDQESRACGERMWQKIPQLKEKWRRWLEESLLIWAQIHWARYKSVSAPRCSQKCNQWSSAHSLASPMRENTCLGLKRTKSWKIMSGRAALKQLSWCFGNVLFGDKKHKNKTHKNSSNMLFSRRPKMGKKRGGLCG